jgi:hypothetical protein
VSRTPHCPFCGAPEVELVSQFGSQILTSQWVCQSCHSYFEAIREDFDDDRPGAGSTPVSVGVGDSQGPTDPEPSSDAK